MQFDILPNEIIAHIITFLPLRYLAPCARVCRRWEQLVRYLQKYLMRNYGEQLSFLTHIPTTRWQRNNSMWEDHTTINPGVMRIDNEVQFRQIRNGYMHSEWMSTFIIDPALITLRMVQLAPSYAIWQNITRHIPQLLHSPVHLAYIVRHQVIPHEMIPVMRKLCVWEHIGKTLYKLDKGSKIIYVKGEPRISRSTCHGTYQGTWHMCDSIDFHTHAWARTRRRYLWLLDMLDGCEWRDQPPPVLP